MDADNPSTDKVFASKFRATKDGGLERVFKIIALCSADEIDNLAKDLEAAADYHHIRHQESAGALRALHQRGEYTISLPEFYMQELTEETMRQVWPNVDEEDRRWIITIGLKLHHASVRLIKQTERERAEGVIPTTEQVEEHLQRGVESIWHEIASDLSSRVGCSEDEAKQVVDHPVIRTYSPEFAVALDNHSDDKYGWTLDEHLRFVKDERELD